MIFIKSGFSFRSSTCALKTGYFWISLVFSLAVTNWCACPTRAANAAEEPLWVGVAKLDVTPKTPVVLAGYGSRNQPFESIATKLWARALVLGKKDPAVFVVVDNCGITSSITERVREKLAKEGFRKERINVAATHTHNAPNLEGYAPILWQGRMTKEQIQATRTYTDQLIDQLVNVVVAAKQKMFPGTLSWGQGRVTFGGNRRVIRDAKWAGFGFQMNAPVDHSLPVLVAHDSKKQVRAIWANYACHCTTLGSANVVAADWAGFANQSIEKNHPNCVSLVSIGCGADVGPQPTGSESFAKAHGKEIADEIETLLASRKLQSLKQVPEIESRVIQLPLETTRERSYWEAQAKTRSFEKELAFKMLQEIKQNGKIKNSVTYPISIWRFGDQLAIVFLPGEVVVDYAVRLKTELNWEKLWITAWTNRMPGYIPSRKVLMEGGYEAEFSQVYYGLPGRYQPSIENLIVKTVRELAGKSFKNAEKAKDFPFRKIPSKHELTFRKFRQQLIGYTASQKEIASRVKDLCSKVPIKQVSNAIIKLERNSPRRDNWYDLHGDVVDRAFIRQQSRQESIVIESKPVAIDSDKSRKYQVIGFTGGLGWISQPKSAGFEMTIRGDSVVFDVVKEPTSWRSNLGTFELIYLPTWKSEEDSAGYFIVVTSPQSDVDKTSKPEKTANIAGEGNQIRVTIHSLASASNRWMGLDVEQNLDRELSTLEKFLNTVELKTEK